jgi:hypothetical protein
MFLLITSCEEENDDDREANSSLIITLNGQQMSDWENSIDFVQEYDGGYHIKWLSWDEDSDRRLHMELGGPREHYTLSTGTFYDTTSIAEIRFVADGIQFNSVENGIITVTNVNKGNKTISGSFEFQANNGDQNNYDVNGEFENFPY